MIREDFGNIYVEIDEPIARFILNRPEKLNAINPEMMAAREEALDWIEKQLDYKNEEQKEVKVIIVEGEGDAFCTGYDMLASSDRYAPGDEDSIPLHDDIAHIVEEAEGWHRLWEIPPVTIAKVHGYALAGGLMISQNCDLVVGAEDAYFGQPAIKSMGFNPDLGLWPFTIGVRKTKELLFTGSVVNGREAESMDMINRAVPEDDLDDAVAELVADITDVDRDMLYYAKKLVNDTYEHMGMGSMIRTAIVYDGLGHTSQARRRFKEIADEEGIEAAIKSVSPDISDQIDDDS
jgi:enoyl-CoA hydratase